MGITCSLRIRLVAPKSLRHRIKLQTCLAVVKEERSRERQSLVHPEPAFNSPLDVFIVFFARATMLNALVPEPPSIWLLSWNIWPLRFLNWPAMLHVIIRRQESFLVTCNSPSEMTKS